MKVIDLGLIDYLKAYEIQKEFVDKVYQKQSEEVIIACSHPEVVTLGRKSEPKDILGFQGPIVHIERGGKATWHGPNQLVVYPIIDLRLRNNDIHLYLRSLEQSLVKTLNDYHIKSCGNPDGTVETTGVWIDDKKVASIGIAIKRGITWHGMAINIDHHPNAFVGINPCGYSVETMTSIEQLLSQKIDRQKFQSRFLEELNSSLNSMPK